jgi:hypothetical protein
MAIIAAAVSLTASGAYVATGGGAVPSSTALEEAADLAVTDATAADEAADGIVADIAAAQVIGAGDASAEIDTIDTEFTALETLVDTALASAEAAVVAFDAYVAAVGVADGSDMTLRYNATTLDTKLKVQAAYRALGDTLISRGLIDYR